MKPVLLPGDTRCYRHNPSVTSRYTLSKRLDGSSWFVAWRFLSIYPTLYYKETQVCPKIKVLSSITLDFHDKSIVYWCCQQNSSTVELVDDTYDTTVDESWLFTARGSAVFCYSIHVSIPYTAPTLQFVADLL